MFDNAIWFFLGAVAYALSSRLMNIRYGVYVFRELEITILSILVSLNVDIKKAFKVKQKAFKESDLPEEIIEKIEKMDEQIIHRWRDIVIAKMIMMTPRYYAKKYQYSNWKQAENFLKKGGMK